MECYTNVKEILFLNSPINDLLEENGILNYKVFIREFKKTFGKTPFFTIVAGFG